MTTVTTNEVTLSHGRTRYLESGSGEPVLLLHGAAIAGGADDFRPLLEVLGDGFRFLAPDLLTFPPGDTFANVDAFPYLTDFLREFQDALGIERSHVIGATMGGWIGGLFAYESPDRVMKLVLTGNPGFQASVNARGAFSPPDEASIRAAIDKVTPMLSAEERTVIAEEKIARIADSSYAEAHGQMVATMGDPAKRARFNLRRRLPHLHMPTLVIFGRGDPSSEGASEIEALLPHGRVEVFEESGHQLHYEDCDRFAKEVVDFLS